MKNFKIPSPYVIVFSVLCFVVVLTYFIPVSVNDPETGKVIYNAVLDSKGDVVQNAGPQPYGFWDILMAPIRGFQNASSISIALLMAGGFLSVMSATGALEAGIGKILKKVKGWMLIALMNLAFCLMGAVFGFWEEILAFSLIVIPMFVMAGYDVMMGLAVLFIGATVGNMASVVNPFSTGAAVAGIASPNLTMGSGLILRMVIFIVLYAVSTLLLVNYGAKIKGHPEKSELYGVKGVRVNVNDTKTEAPEMTRRRLASALMFVGMILLLILGYIPWEGIAGGVLGKTVNAPFIELGKIELIGDIFGARHITPFGEWGFDEFSAVFFAGSIILMLVNRINVDDFLKYFISGAKSLLGVIIVLSIARGIAIVMGSSSQGMSVTLVYWVSNALQNVPHWMFPLFAIGAYMLIGLALQSTIGVAAISMPILGPVVAALFASESIGQTGGEIILISAFTIGLNFMGLIYPGAVNLGTIQMFNVPYSHFLKFMLRCSLPLLIIAAILLSIARYVGLVF